MKFSDVVADRFRGPTHQDFSTWLKKVELAFRVTRTDEAAKVDVLVAYMDAPAQDLAIAFVDKYRTDNAPPTAAGPLRTYNETLYDQLVAYLRTKSAVVGTRPELRLLDLWKNFEQRPAETVGEYYHRMNVLLEKLASQDRPFKPDELGVWSTFVNGLRRDLQIHVRTQAPKPGPVETAVEAAEVYEDVHKLMGTRDADRRKGDANLEQKEPRADGSRGGRFGQFQRTRGTILERETVGQSLQRPPLAALADHQSPILRNRKHPRARSTDANTYAAPVTDPQSETATKRKAPRREGELTPGCRSQICFPYLRNATCRYGDSCYRVHVPNLDARADVRSSVKTPVTDAMRAEAQGYMQEYDKRTAQRGGRSDQAAIRDSPDFSAPRRQTRAAQQLSGVCMMVAGPEPEYVDCVMSQESTVADYTSPHTPPRVRVRIGNVECTALVDTGSRANLISQELYDFIVNDEESEQPAIHGKLDDVGGALHGAGTEQLPLIGAVSLNIVLTPSKSFRARFLVADRLMTDMLWGDHLLGPEHLDTVIDLRKRTVWSRRLQFAMHMESPACLLSQEHAEASSTIRAMYQEPFRPSSGSKSTAPRHLVRSLSALTAEDMPGSERDSDIENVEPRSDRAEDMAVDWHDGQPTKGFRRPRSMAVHRSPNAHGSHSARPRKVIRCGMVRPLSPSPAAADRRSTRGRVSLSEPAEVADTELGRRARASMTTPPRRRRRTQGTEGSTRLDPNNRSIRQTEATNIQALRQVAEEEQDNCERCSDTMGRREGRRRGACTCRAATERLRLARLRTDVCTYEWNALWLNGDYIWRPCRVETRVPAHAVLPVTDISIHTEDGGYLIVHPAYVRAYDEDLVHRRAHEDEIRHLLRVARRHHPADGIDVEEIYADEQSGAAQIAPVDELMLAEARLEELWPQRDYATAHLPMPTGPGAPEDTGDASVMLAAPHPYASRPTLNEEDTPRFDLEHGRYRRSQRTAPVVVGMITPRPGHGRPGCNRKPLVNRTARIEERDVDTNRLIAVHASARAAARAIHRGTPARAPNSGNICRALNGTRQTAFNRRWNYVPVSSAESAHLCGTVESASHKRHRRRTTTHTPGGSRPSLESSTGSCQRHSPYIRRGSPHWHTSRLRQESVDSYPSAELPMTSETPPDEPVASGPEASEAEDASSEDEAPVPSRTTPTPSVSGTGLAPSRRRPDSVTELLELRVIDRIELIRETVIGYQTLSPTARAAVALVDGALWMAIQVLRSNRPRIPASATWDLRELPLQDLLVAAVVALEWEWRYGNGADGGERDTLASHTLEIAARSLRMAVGQLQNHVTKSTDHGRLLMPKMPYPADPTWPGHHPDSPGSETADPEAGGENREHSSPAGTEPESAPTVRRETSETSSSDDSDALVKDLAPDPESGDDTRDLEGAEISEKEGAEDARRAPPALEERHTLTDEVLAVHSNPQEAARKIGRKSARRIVQALLGERTTAHGRRWNLVEPAESGTILRFRSTKEAPNVAYVGMVAATRFVSARPVVAAAAPNSSTNSSAGSHEPDAESTLSPDEAPSYGYRSTYRPRSALTAADLAFYAHEREHERASSLETSPGYRHSSLGDVPFDAENRHGQTRGINITQLSPVTGRAVRAWSSKTAAARALRLTPFRVQTHLNPSCTGNIVNLDGRLLRRDSAPQSGKEPSTEKERADPQWEEAPWAVPSPIRSPVPTTPGRQRAAARLRPVAYALDGTEVSRWADIPCAAAAFGVKPHQVYYACMKDRPTWGYRWQLLPVGGPRDEIDTPKTRRPGIKGNIGNNSPRPACMMLIPVEKELALLRNEVRLLRGQTKRMATELGDGSRLSPSACGQTPVRPPKRFRTTGPVDLERRPDLRHLRPGTNSSCRSPWDRPTHKVHRRSSPANTPTTGEARTEMRVPRARAALTPGRSPAFARGLDGRWHRGRIAGLMPSDYHHWGLADALFLRFRADEGDEYPVPQGAVLEHMPTSHDAIRRLDVRRVSMIGATHTYYAKDGIMRAACILNGQIRFAGCAKALATCELDRLFEFDKRIVGQTAPCRVLVEYLHRRLAKIEAAAASSQQPAAIKPHIEHDFSGVKRQTSERGVCLMVTDGPGPGRVDEPASRMKPKIDPVAQGARFALSCAYTTPSGARTEKENCTLDEIRSDRYHVLSVDPAIFDDPLLIPVIVLFAGIGGISLGIRAQLENSPFTYVTVVAVECEGEIQAAHQLTHPAIPCVRYFLSDTDDSLRTLERFLPRRLWPRAWVHASPSCRLASSVNAHRDLSKAADCTEWAVQLMRRINPACWTLEQAPTLFDDFEGKETFVSNMKFSSFCALGQDRTRMILSNQRLSFRWYHEPLPTARDRLASRWRWPTEPLSSSHRMQNSYQNERSVDGPAFAVTSGTHLAGALDGETWEPCHQLDWIDRALLQGIDYPEETLRFLPSANERQKRKMVANMIPPPFAAAMHEAVDRVLQNALHVGQRLLAGIGDPALVDASPPLTENDDPSAEGEAREERAESVGGPCDVRVRFASDLPTGDSILAVGSVSTSGENRSSPTASSDLQFPAVPAEPITPEDAHNFDSDEPAVSSEPSTATAHVLFFGATGELLAETRSMAPTGTLTARVPSGSGRDAERALQNLVHSYRQRTGYNLPVAELAMIDQQTRGVHGEVVTWYHARSAKLGDRSVELPKGEPALLEPEWIRPKEFTSYHWDLDIVPQLAMVLGSSTGSDGEHSLHHWADADSRLAEVVRRTLAAVAAKPTPSWQICDGAGDIGASRTNPELVTPVTAEEFAEIFRFGEADSQIDIDLTDTRRQAVLDVLWKHRTLFLQPKRLGVAKFPPHDIEVTTTRPLSQQPYRVGPAKQEEIARQVQKLIDLDCVEPSTSPWASPVVLVAKPDGSWRFCVDYRALNAHTVRDVYPLPRIQDTLHMLGGNQYFTSLDLLSGFFQIPLSEDAKQKTAFITSSGLFQFKVLSMGMANSPAAFQRGMNQILAGLINVCCMCYVDDILIFSRTWERHLEDLHAVFTRLADALLFVKPTKCSFGACKLQYLGHEIAADGLRPAPKHVEAVSRFPTPRTKTALKSFLGLASFNRLFIENFAIITAPLRQLLRLEVSPDLTLPMTVDGDGTVRPNSLWDDDCEAAFQKLKTALCTAPVLGYPDWTKSFTLRTDASIEGLGAVLRQGDRVIAYLSRSLTPAEARLDVRELECLAVLYACESLRPYLQNNRPFLIQTDHKNLTWLRNVKHDSGRLARWALRLSEFSYFLEHIPGTANSEADALSRNPVAFAAPVTAMAICAATDDIQPIVWSPRTVDPQPSRAEFVEEQKRDPFCQLLRQRARTCSSAAFTHEGATLCVEDDMLLNLHQVGDEIRRRIVVPERYRQCVMWNAHNSAFGGHCGRDRTIARLQLDYYWPKLGSDVRNWCRTCHECQKARATRPRNRGLMQLPKPSIKPFQTVGIDLLGPLPLSLRGNRYVLTVLDHFSHWPILIPVPNKEARTLAEALFMNVICEHGAFERLLSDRESTLAAPVVAALVKMMKTKRVYTSAYQPSTNGMVERCHRWINAALRTYSSLSPTDRDWETSLKIAEWAYRTSTLTGTEFTPFFVLYGRHPIFPQDALNAQTMPKTRVATHDYVSKLQQQLAIVHDRLGRITNKLRLRMKEYYDRSRVDMEFDVGNLVLAFFPPLASSHVMTSWRGPFEIVEKVTPLTYRLKNLATGETYKELSNINRLALYHREHEPLVSRGEAATPATGAASAARVEPTSPPNTKEQGNNEAGETKTNEENRTAEKIDSDEEKSDDEEGDLGINGEEIANEDPDLDGNVAEAETTTAGGVEQSQQSGEGDVLMTERGKATGRVLDFTTMSGSGGFSSAHPVNSTGTDVATRTRHKQRLIEQERQLDQKIDEAIEKALNAPVLAADPDPAEAFAEASPAPPGRESPVLAIGDMVIVKLDPRLYDTFIPPAERARKERRGRKARAAPARGAEREAQHVVWRVAEVIQVIPPTPEEEMAIHVHLYDSHEHHLDVALRSYHPAYRDTLADKDVYNSAFRGALAKPNHYVEFKDTLKISQLLTRPFTLRKDGKLPHHVVEQLLPYLVAHVRLRA